MTYLTGMDYAQTTHSKTIIKVKMVVKYFLKNKDNFRILNQKRFCHLFQENDVLLNPIRGDLKFIDYEIKKKTLSTLV